MQSTISSGCTESLAQNSLSLGLHTHTLYLDSVIAYVTTGHVCDNCHTFSTGTCPNIRTGLHTLRDRTRGRFKAQVQRRRSAFGKQVERRARRPKSKQGRCKRCGSRPEPRFCFQPEIITAIFVSLLHRTRSCDAQVNICKAGCRWDGCLRASESSPWMRLVSTASLRDNGRVTFVTFAGLRALASTQFVTFLRKKSLKKAGYSRKLLKFKAHLY